MRVFVLIPVFNRLTHTQKVLEALRAQSVAAQLRIVIINDGSTDGTAEYLAKQADIVALQGNGHLWWGGAIQKGLEYVRTQRPAGEDYVLFLNNDTLFNTGYIETLIETSRTYGNAAVGSVIHEPERTPPLTSIGARININRLAVWDKLAELQKTELLNLKPVYQVDALSGRGTLYPACLFSQFGEMRPRLLPHYFADYEISMRFHRKGVPLLVSSKAIIYSPSVYGNDVSQLSLWNRWFSPRSASNVIYKTNFYLLVGSWPQRLTAPLRLIYFSIARRLSEWQS